MEEERRLAPLLETTGVSNCTRTWGDLGEDLAWARSAPFAKTVVASFAETRQKVDAPGFNWSVTVEKVRLVAISFVLVEMTLLLLSVSEV